MRFYDEDKLDEAEKRFREIVQRFPRNVIADRADYYLIRTLNERGKRTDALNRINAFARAYPKSKWAIDVEELRVRLTSQVSPTHMLLVTAPPGTPFVTPPAPPAPAPPQPFPSQFNSSEQARAAREQAQAIREQQQAVREQQQAVRQQQFALRGAQAAGPGRTPADPEVALQQEIMRAVFQNNPERAIEIATDRLKNNPSDPLVLSSLYLVAESRSAQALPMLLTIVKNAKNNARARKDAIFWISQSRGDREMVVDTLVGLLPSLTDDEAESVSFALGQVRNERATNALATLARDRSKSQKIRDSALFWIGESRTPNRVSLLQDIYKSSMDNPKMRQQVTFALSQTRDPQATPVLGSIASTDPDIEVRKQAVFWLGQVRSPEAQRALENLLQKR
jgi:tetratricopeptide (TPR) repeat protein